MESAMEDRAELTLSRLLRKHRKRRGVMVKEAAEIMGCSPGQASRIETGTRLPSPANIRALTTAYSLSTEESSELVRLLELANEADEPWWRPFGVAGPYERLLRAEESAVSCRDYQTVLISALLQIRDYARAVTGAGVGDLGAGQVDAYTEVRVRRQLRLAGERPLKLDVILTEAALRFVVGESAVHKAQLRHLLTTVEREPNITVRVIRYEAGENGTQAGTFSLYEMPHGEADIAFGESVMGTTVVTTALDIRRLQRLYGALGEAALTREASYTFIGSLV